MCRAIVSRGDWTQTLHSKTLYREVRRHGLDVDTREKDMEGRTVLHGITMLDDIFLLALFLPKLEDMNVNARDCWNSTPLHYSARGENVAILQHLIYMGADVDATNVFGNTPLHNAARNKRLKAVRTLLSHGARRDIRNKAKFTFLDYLEMEK